MTWVCDNNFHMQEADDAPHTEQRPRFLINYMDDTATEQGRNRFYADATMDIDHNGINLGAEMGNNADVWCHDCGESARNLVGMQLLQRYVDIALERGWVLCAHGDGTNPVLIDCDACFEDHAYATAHEGLDNTLIDSPDAWQTQRARALGQARHNDPTPGIRVPTVRIRRAMPNDVTTADGVVLEYNIVTGHYQRRRPAPRTLHDLEHSNGR